MSKQRSTSSKGGNFNAKLVRHCFRFWQQSRTLLRHCCWCGPGFSRSLRRLSRGGVASSTFRHTSVANVANIAFSLARMNTVDRRRRSARRLHSAEFAYIGEYLFRLRFCFNIGRRNASIWRDRWQPFWVLAVTDHLLKDLLLLLVCLPQSHLWSASSFGQFFWNPIHRSPSWLVMTMVDVRCAQWTSFA